MNSTVQEYVDRIDELLEDDDYSDSVFFLDGVRKWISDNDFITETQMKAIDEVEPDRDLYIERRNNDW